MNATFLRSFFGLVGVLSEGLSVDEGGKVSVSREMSIAANLVRGFSVGSAGSGTDTGAFSTPPTTPSMSAPCEHPEPCT